jgi:1,4-alpha-glucan branching enzyme
MGATLTATGATFRLWAPEARTVAVRGSFNDWTDHALAPSGGGHWFASIPGVRAGDEYKFHVVGNGSRGPKRDPYAREIGFEPPWPHSNCLVTRQGVFEWHDGDFRTPAFHELVLYQLHVGAFFATDANGLDVRRQRPGRFLDVLFRLEHLAALGVTAVQLLPIQEFTSARSLGYNGTDFFSPEMDYCLPPSDPDFGRYVAKANQLLTARGRAPYAPGQLDDQSAQLMAIVDLFHVYGIAVIFDVVYNHAGGDFGDESLYFLDRQELGDQNRSLYFTDQGWAGGLVFAYWKREVRQFLVDNAVTLMREYHLDGFRFDDVTVIDRNGGWVFLQDLTDTLRFVKPEALLIAEYWADQRAVVRPRAEGGAGFDAVVASDLRGAIRHALGQAAQGREGAVDFDRVAAALSPAHGAAWRSVQHLENHDVVRINNETDREPRIPALADASNPRSWYARSRSRVATSLLFTAPGIPMLFMGQEILEEKYWSDSPDFFADTLIGWGALETDAAMRDQMRLVRDLLALRRTRRGLTGDRVNAYHVHNTNRVLAFHRWTDQGDDIVVVATLSETTWGTYDLGFPRPGTWHEIFNSDVYDGWVNPHAAGNGGRIVAHGPPSDGLAQSATLVIPANGVLIFAAE